MITKLRCMHHVRFCLNPLKTARNTVLKCFPTCRWNWAKVKVDDTCTRLYISVLTISLSSMKEVRQWSLSMKSHIQVCISFWGGTNCSISCFPWLECQLRIESEPSTCSVNIQCQFSSWSLENFYEKLDHTGFDVCSCSCPEPNQLTVFL